MEGRLVALARAHDLLMQVSWSNANLTHTLSGATEPYDSQGTRRFHFNGPDIRITSGAVIALAMTLNELCTNTIKFGALCGPPSGGDRVTQEFLAEMLGVRRTSVTGVASRIQAAEAINYSRGQITILKRPALKKMSCECYQTLVDQSAILIQRPSGTLEPMIRTGLLYCPSSRSWMTASRSE
jgi:hypothetical protein